MRYTISPAVASLLLPFAAAAEVPRVVTDIPPVHALVAQVMGDLGSPELLLTKGADEHDFSLKPSQMQAISEAGLVVWIGPELTPWLDRALEANGADVVQLALLHADGTQLRDYSGEKGDEPEDEPAHDGEDHDHAAEGAEAEHHDHDHGDHDPHAWLDPQNAVIWTSHIAAELSKLDPEHAETYAANAKATEAQIAALDADIATLLAPVKDRPFVTFHAAYGYFGAHYGLSPAGSLALGDAATPGAARLQALHADLAAGGAVCAFPEVQHDPALLAQVMDGTPTKLGGAIDPVGSSLEPGPDAYDALLRGLATTLATCLKP